MTKQGTIFDIKVLSEGSAQIVLKHKDRGKIVPVAYFVFGYWKDKAIKELQLKQKDKIRANVYMKSNFYNGKWHTDVFFREIIVLQKAREKQTTFIDKETGEIFQ